MSHFTQIQTQMVELAWVELALQDLKCHYEIGETTARGYLGQQTPVDIRITTTVPGYDIGLRFNGRNYEIIADWYGLGETMERDWPQRLSQRYAYHATKSKLREQGFELVQEELADQSGPIHLTFRRMA